MKHYIKSMMLFAWLMSMASTSYAFNLKDLLKAASGSDSTTTDTSSSSGSLGNILGNLLSTDKLTVSSLVGSWQYSAPAVTFRSSNLLMKAGGAAATGTIEKKLEPYYTTAGLTSLKLTVNADSTFVMNLKRISLKGSISEATGGTDGANFSFKFKALGTRTIGSLDAYMTKNASGEITLTFDVSKLLALLEKISVITNNKTAQGLTSILTQYDGVCAGFSLKAAASTH
ncbi:MAG: DUF4923 family protein [Muribaculaceae bacterium]|nr:DUF4923 family protein [Muribaculaceae bacterium]